MKFSPSICLSLFVAMLTCAAGAAPAAAQDFSAVIDGYLAGENDDRTTLLEGGMPAIEALEDRVLAENTVDEEGIGELVELLSADTYAERERATRSLERAGDSVVLMLVQFRDTVESPEARYRLERILQILQSQTYASALPDLLVTLYEKNLAEVAPLRMTALGEDPHDARALLFVKLSPRRQTNEVLETGDNRLRILYLLARLYSLHDRASIGSGFRDFTFEEVLEVAQETYWPLELEPLNRELGSWRATYAGRMEGTMAHDVLSFNLETRLGKYGRQDEDEDAEQGPSLRVSGCDSYLAWVYLWRYATPAEGQAAVADNKGAGVVLGIAGPSSVSLNVVSHVDPELPLPVVRVSDREKTFWLTGSALEWARPFIPPQYVEFIRFRRRSYDPAEILSVPEGMQMPGEAGAGEEPAEESAEQPAGEQAAEPSEEPAGDQAVDPPADAADTVPAVPE